MPSGTAILEYPGVNPVWVSLLQPTAYLSFPEPKGLALFSQAPADHNFHPVYRPDIDGLRAIAILSVLVFHAFPSSFKGGYVGVDVFFVISGYLISSIIFKSLHRDDFSFTEFYVHRVNRIFPALIFVFAASYAFGWFALLPGEFEQLGKHMVAGAGFAENFVLWQEAGYFDIASALKPMMHLWSLSIEEQFYLIYPLLIWGAWWLRLNFLMIVILLGTVSFALNVHDVVTDTAKAFFMPQTRFWELLVGAMLAYLHLFKQVQLEGWLKRPLFHRSSPPLAQKWMWNNILSIIGLLLIVVSVFGINKGKAFPGWWALLPVLGAFLLILSGPAAWVNRKVLARRTMVFVGLISYPLYLWHWPMLSFARILEVKLPSLIVRISLVFASIVLAWITYRFVEKPIRFGVRKKSKTVALVLIMLLIMGLGYLTYQGSMPWRVPPQKEARQIEFSKNDFEFPPGSFVAGKSGRIVSYTHAGLSTAEKTLFLGDSNLEQYGPRIEKVILEATEPTNGAVLIPIQKNCDIFFSVFTGQGCEYQIEEVFRISRDENIKKLVVAVSWLKYEKSLEDAAGKAALADFLEKVSRGKQVFIIRNIPRDPENLPPDSLYTRRLSVEGGKIGIIERTSPMDTYVSTFRGVDMALRQIAAATNAALISPTDYWCPNDFCPSLDPDGYPLYKDDGHITASFSRRAATFIDQTLKPLSIEHRTASQE